jgi:hypothetical protein
MKDCISGSCLRVDLLNISQKKGHCIFKEGCEVFSTVQCPFREKKHPDNNSGDFANAINM